jgi:hypothetical protein
MRARLATVGAALAIAVGCGQGQKATLVQGKVLYRGSPVPCGMIVFTPDAGRGGSGPFARAEIHSDGSYDLRTGESAGAGPGWYRVTVVAVEASAGPSGFAVPRSLVPAKYRDPELSGLECEVKAGQSNHINFDLQ